jgi:hypothetical protein
MYKYTKHSVYVFIFFLTFLNAKGQGISVLEDTLRKNNLTIDPARYQGLVLINLGTGSSFYSKANLDNWLNAQEQKTSPSQSVSLNMSLDLIDKKNMVGFHGSLNIPSNSNPEKIGLNQSSLLVSYGRTNLRENQNLGGLKLNIGIRFNTLQAPNQVLPYLQTLNLDHSASRLRNTQLVFGPSFQYNRLFLNKKNYYRGGLVAFEIGALYAPFKSKWKYGFTDAETDEFIGVTIDGIGKNVTNYYFVKVKFGLWTEGHQL